ncbi:MAG TPA: META domain-containing protein [Gemmatimonadaceae bacterium]|nr:META domain-containing protein [Gemmatimonadaceae bacterium]
MTSYIGEMVMSHARLSTILLACLLGVSCSPEPGHEDSTTTPPTSTPSVVSQSVITDRDWELITLGEHTNPRGTQDRPLTLRLNREDSHAGGFAGCNGYGATYVLRGDRLRFEAPTSTRMFCEGVQDVENAFLGALPQVTMYTAIDSTLTLRGAQGPIATFQSR